MEILYNNANNDTDKTISLDLTTMTDEEVKFFTYQGIDLNSNNIKEIPQLIINKIQEMNENQKTDFVNKISELLKTTPLYPAQLVRYHDILTYIQDDHTDMAQEIKNKIFAIQPEYFMK